MTQSHTPGPWEVDDESIYAKNSDGSWQQVAELPGWRTNKGEVMSDTDRANARLIAAAPDLLAACHALMRAEPMQEGKRGGEIMGQISLAIDAARAAIAKAKGE